MANRSVDTQSLIAVLVIMVLLLAACAGPSQVAVKETATDQAEPKPTVIATPSPAPQSEGDLVQILPHSLAWDPSGRWLAYTSADGRAWLRTHESETLVPVEGIHLVNPAELNVAWSPDGSRLLVYGEWGYPRSTGLWLVPVSDEGAGEAHPIVAPVEASSPVEQNSGAIEVAAWSPDGKQIAYTLQAEAWLHDLDSGQSQQVTGLTEQPLFRSGSTESFDGVREIAWSPDGRFLALGLSCNCPSPWSGVGVVDLDSRQTRLLVDGGHSVSWSPDGRWIAFQNASGDWTGGSTFDFYGVDPGSGKTTNLTQSNPGWDPLRPAEGTYRDADYQTASLHWGTGGSFLYETLDYSVEGGVAPARGFVVQSDPMMVLEARLGEKQAWYVFPIWLANGRYSYLVADPENSDPQTYAIHQAVVGQQTMPIELVYVRGAVWATDGSAVALCVTDGPGSPSSRVRILTFEPTENQEPASQLIVEEYPIVVQETDSPDHLEYLQRIGAAILSKRQAWREPHPVKLAEPANKALVAFGYRLELAYGARVTTYHLLQNDTVIREGITRFGPVTVNERGDDFAFLIEVQHRNMEIVQRGKVQTWEPGPEVRTPPVYWGNELITTYQEGWKTIRVKRGDEVLYTVQVEPQVDNPVKGLWAWNGHWVLEIDSQVIIDGQSLNQDLGYDEIFGWTLLDGNPFYFFSQDGHIGLSYAGETLPYTYEKVIHNQCCEPAAFNPGHNEEMVWFHALKNGIWHYVEAGIYR